jgi:hypothetical protein
LIDLGERGFNDSLKLYSPLLVIAFDHFQGPSGSKRLTSENHNGWLGG